jgi:hypothetical protein
MFSKKSKLVTLISSALLLLGLKYVTDHGVEALSWGLQLLVYASIPTAGGLIALSLASLLEPSSDVENSTIFLLQRRISEDPSRNFLVGFLGSAYLNLVRTSLVINVPFLPYIEWVSIVLAVYVMYSAARFSSEDFNAGSEDLGWKKHVQEVSREPGRDLMRVKEVMAQFVHDAVKEPLLVYLTLHLQRLGKTEEEILKTLSPLIAYRLPSRGFFAFLRTRGKIATKEEEARDSLLSAVFEEIDRMRS